MVNSHRFDQTLAGSKMPVKWMKFYVKFILLFSAFSAGFLFLQSINRISLASVTDVLDLVFIAVSIVLPILAYIEMKKLSVAGYYLNIGFLLFGPLRYALMAFLTNGTYESVTVMLVWALLNFLYFRNRRQLFDGKDAGLNAAQGVGAVPAEKKPVSAEAKPVPMDVDLVFRHEMDMMRNELLLSDIDYKSVMTAHEILNARRAAGTVSKQEQAAVPEAAAPAPTASPAPTQRIAPARERRVLTKQEIRDRNITLVLILGVMFVLTAGVIFATSNWSFLGSAVKTALVAFVAVMFFGTSLLAEKKLKIPKTAVAFWSLGALFVPITVFSAGYFQLFGDWLSITGEGRYVLGVIGATASAAIFAISTYRYRNRLFAWLTLAAFSIDAVFIIASFRPEIDIFYLCVAAYNWMLMLFFLACTSPANSKMPFRFKKVPENLKIYLRELRRFITANLGVFSVLTVLFYDDPRINGINIILIAVLCLLMALTRWQKELSYPFILLLVYGIYQIVENSALSAAAFVIYALIGFIFAGIEYFTKGREQLRNIFSNASGAAGMLAFLYITFKWSASFYNAASAVTLAAYLLTALNFFYLSYRAGKIEFTYPVPVIILAAGYQAFLFIKLSFAGYLLSAHVFLISAIMFAALYYFNGWKYTKPVSLSCGIAAPAAMFASYGLALSEGSYKTAVLILLVFAVVLYMIHGRLKTEEYKVAIKWAIPAVIALDIFTVYWAAAPYAQSSGAYWYTENVHFGFTAAALYLISLALRRFDKVLAANSFWVSHALIPAAVILLIRDHYDFPPLFMVPAAIYLYSLRLAVKDKGNRYQLMGFLYAAYSASALSVYSSAAAAAAPHSVLYYVMPLCSAVLAGIWFFSKDNWKTWTAWYFMPFSLAGGLLLSVKPDFSAADFGLVIIYVVLMIYVMHKSGSRNLAWLALLLLFPGTTSFYNTVLGGDDVKLMITLLVLYAALMAAGHFIYKSLFDIPKEGNRLLAASVDWYSAASLVVSVVMMADVANMENPGWMRMIGPLCLSFTLFSQRKRVGGPERVRIADTLWIVSLLLPYEIMIDLLGPAEIISTEIRLLPLMLIQVYLARRVWKGFEKANDISELVVLVFICLALFRDIFMHDYLADALIMGVLSIALLFAGIQLHKRQYFIIGAASLTINGIFQTREFWESLPWWAYLLIAGLILIGIASYNEVKKRKKESERK